MCDDDIYVCVKLQEEDLIALVIVKVKGGGIEIIQDEHVVRKMMVKIDQIFNSWGGLTKGFKITLFKIHE